jgi:methyl-accepting chemotaxis protein
MSSLYHLTMGQREYQTVEEESWLPVRIDIYNICSTAALKVIYNNQSYTVASQRNSIILVVLSVLISLFIGLVVVIAISNPLKTMETATKALALGDLTQDVSAEGSPEDNLRQSVAVFNLEYNTEENA